jgi:diguanylate cyclase (GGDEF)-like protein/PAS domain S-box-containing protein
MELPARRKNGETLTVELTLTAADAPPGDRAAGRYVVVIARDITERIRAAEERAARVQAELAEQRIASILERMSDAFFALDREWCFTYLNGQAERLLGRSRGELIGHSTWEEFPALRGTALYQEAQRAAAQRAAVHFEESLPPSGTWFEVHVYPSADGLSVYLQDITDRRRAEEDLERLALHDTLTQLPNRTLLQDRLEQAIHLAQRQGDALALLFLDLDRFKEVNDTFGHHAGDLLLQEIGRRLPQVLRESDTVARLGGDEFAVILPEASASTAHIAAEKLLMALARPIVIEGYRLDVGGSIGIALYPEHATDAVNLMRYADIAMYTAKRGGSGMALYSADADVHSPGRLALLSELRHALAANQLVLHYQPVVRFATGRATRVEALVRWQHPRYDLLPPDQFVPLAERTGLINELTRWVLAAGIGQCAAWQRQGLSTGLAVNLSARNLHDPELPETIADLLHQHGLPAASLKLELTESSIMADPDAALAVLQRLRSTGVRIAIDDFGTGYSSLAYLRRLPVDEIKIDKSFVLNMATNENDAVIVRSAIELAHALGLQVVAEGVEDAETWERLARLGCDAGQAYYVAHPMPAEEMVRWLQQPGRQPPSSAAADVT